MADPYGINPLADEIRERDPFRFEEVSKFAEPPKLFANGTADVPAFTASGIDPQHLLKLPVGIRHAAAANPDIVQVHSWFEEYAGIPEAEIDHDGLRAAKLRVEDWLANTDTDPRTPEQREADEEAEYQGFFNPENDRVSYANEQRRREEVGEEPLEDFLTIQQRKTWEANQAARVADDDPARPDGFTDAQLAQLGEMMRAAAARSEVNQ
jgi:hypothetical protein